MTFEEIGMSARAAMMPDEDRFPFPEEYEEDTEPEIDSEMKAAVDHLTAGLDRIDEGLDDLAEAVTALGDTDLGHEIDWHQATIEHICNRIEEIRDAIERGDIE